MRQTAASILQHIALAAVKSSASIYWPATAATSASVSPTAHRPAGLSPSSAVVSANDYRAERFVRKAAYTISFAPGIVLRIREPQLAKYHLVNREVFIGANFLLKR
jgi:hypothetical protein